MFKHWAHAKLDILECQRDWNHVMVYALNTLMLVIEQRLDGQVPIKIGNYHSHPN